MYNFDDIKPRKGSSSLKYDFAAKRGRPDDVLPLWVADMDFPAPKEVQEALIERCEHGIFGYTQNDDSYYEAVINWFQRRHDLTLKPNWILTVPGVVYGICMVIQALTKENDAVLIQRPVYYPFFESIELNNRRVVSNSLINVDGKYQIDFEDFEKKVVEEKVKLFVLCSPHNPVGRVWSKKELEKMGDICLRHGVYVVADEIHADFVYGSNKHISFLNVKEEFKNNTILCTSASKTFNLAGLMHATMAIPDRELRNKVKNAMYSSGISDIPLMGMIACKAAYNHGEVWLEELKEYLKNNLNFIRNYLNENLPKVKLIEPEGTYLVWLDFREYGLSVEELEHLVTHKAKLWLDGGTMFGEEGAGYQRINITTNKETIEKALNALKEALEG